MAQYPRIEDPSTVNSIPNDTVKKEVLDYTQWRIYYDYTIKKKANDPYSIRNTIALLQIGQRATVFRDYHSFRTDSMLDVNAKAKRLPSEYINELLKENHKSQFAHVVAYDRRTKGWTEQQSVPSEMRSRYSEASIPMAWTTVKGDTLIAEYKCHKAVAKYRGRDYIAWYTEEINMPYGPYKFYGLPGLVMKVEDTLGHHVFTFRGMEQVKKYEPIYINSSNLVIRDRETHRKILRNAIENLSKTITESGRIQVSKEDRASLNAKKTPYNPIELE
ncbi:GLPGLI family protein [Porphyromonas sp.]|uniref:GLPGLI family protein n=1 Tax=Porphyromonas sp. TaxID=1924944 RepID=UPI0026DB6648|nr:GLPGLI family protein [Porphyromonas sp.]